MFISKAIEVLVLEFSGNTIDFSTHRFILVLELAPYLNISYYSLMWEVFLSICCFNWLMNKKTGLAYSKVELNLVVEDRLNAGRKRAESERSHGATPGERTLKFAGIP